MKASKRWQNLHLWVTEPLRKTLWGMRVYCVFLWSIQMEWRERREDKKKGDWFDFMVSGSAGEKWESSASPMTGCSCVNGSTYLGQVLGAEHAPSHVYQAAPEAENSLRLERLISTWALWCTRTRQPMSLRLKALVFCDTDTQVALLLAFQVLPCVNLRGLVPHQASLLTWTGFEELSDQTAA